MGVVPAGLGGDIEDGVCCGWTGHEIQLGDRRIECPFPGAQGEASHAGISSCWTPTRSKVGSDPPRRSRWTSSHSSAASRMRRMA